MTFVHEILCGKDRIDTLSRLHTIIRLELVPGFVKCRKHSSADHLNFDT